MKLSSVVVGEDSSVFGDEIPASDEEDAGKNEDGTAVFNSSWLPGNNSKYASLFLCSSFTDKLSCIHNYMHHSCTPPHIDIGTNFFILHLRDALLSGKNNLQKQKERGKSRRKREQPLMMMLWRTWFLVLTKMGLQAAALLLGKMTMQIIIHLQNKNASRSTEQKG